MIGQTISHYRIIEKLGEGGMGVVYKADDTKLDRPVALKFLASHLVSDEEVRKRFEREAKAAAGLHHPNICTVHEIDEFEGKTFIAMAFLAGEGLDRKIESGPLKLKDALDIAIQTAQGLQAAHERGIVHRDIKPANLMVTNSGPKQLVTIMDFGLAQLADRSKLTRMDETMGTVTYMSPEQTYGAEIDRRSDIWSLGVVIYEMVTGQQPFKGHYDKAVMYSITNEEPEPMTALRTGIPMELEWLVGKCLAKDSNERYQSTADMVVDLETLRKKLESGRSTIMPAGSAASVMTGAQTGLTHTPAQAGPLAKYRIIEDIQEPDDAVKYLAEDTELHRSVAIRVLPQSSAERVERAQRRKQALLIGATALTALLAVIFAFFPLSSPPPATEAPVWRFSIAPEGLQPRARLSPDGKYIAYTTEKENESVLWLRPLGSEMPRRIEGTEGARSSDWSPDSESIVFGTDRELKRIAIDGGAPITLCVLPAPGGPYAFLGASWSPDGNRIVFSSGLQLYEIPARGGEPTLLFEPDEGKRMNYFWAPHFLPSVGASEGLVYTAASGPNDARVWLLDVRTGEERELTPGRDAVYSKSEHLIYHPGNNTDAGLQALPFSVETLAVTGKPFPIEENGRWASVASDGTLAYYDSGTSRFLPRLVWKDRAGKTLSTIGQPQVGIHTPSLSPDGRRVAVGGKDEERGGTEDIWLHEVSRPVKTRLTFDEGYDSHPTWLPAGDAITFTSDRSGDRELYLRRIDASSPAEPLLKPDSSVRRWPSDWSKDGRLMLFYERPVSDPLAHDLWYLERRDDGSGYQAVPLLQTPFSEITAVFSPDHQWVAYTSNESGRYEVYIRSFPDGQGKQQVSINGGARPRWSQEGEIFYVEESTFTLMAVPVSMSPTLTIGQPQQLFSSDRLGVGTQVFTYDVTPDGQQFVMSEVTEGESEAGDKLQPAIRIVRNWYEEFRDREQD